MKVKVDVMHSGITNLFESFYFKKKKEIIQILSKKH